MQYIILQAEDCDQLTTLVNEYIKNGYQLAGGVSVSLGEVGDQIFIQALTI